MNEMGALWDSLWQGPKIGGMIFAAALLVALLVVRAFRMRRSRHANDERCRRLIWLESDHERDVYDGNRCNREAELKCSRK